MTDAALIAIVTAITTIVTALGTIWLKGMIDVKLKGIEVKIDGRLTELLETTRLLAAAEGMEKGKEQGRESQKADAKELKEGNSGVKIDAKSVDITTPQVNLGEKKGE